MEQLDVAEYSSGSRSQDRSAVGTGVVNDEDRGGGHRSADPPQDVLDVGRLLVRGQHDQYAGRRLRRGAWG
jgi:hypothetical protein